MEVTTVNVDRIQASGPGAMVEPQGSHPVLLSGDLSTPGPGTPWNEGLCESCRMRPGWLIDSRFDAPAFLVCPGCWLP